MDAMPPSSKMMPSSGHRGALSTTSSGSAVGGMESHATDTGERSRGAVGGVNLDSLGWYIFSEILGSIKTSN